MEVRLYVVKDVLCVLGITRPTLTKYVKNRHNKNFILAA